MSEQSSYWDFIDAAEETLGLYLFQLLFPSSEFMNYYLSFSKFSKKLNLINLIKQHCPKAK